MRSQAIRIDRNGGPEELKIVDVEVGEPGPGEIRIRHHAVGLNFIDTYQRSGLYPLSAAAAARHGGRGRGRGGGRGRHAPEGRRPCRLCQPAARRLLRAARDAGQVRLQAARRDLLRDRRGHDAQGPDGAVPAEEDLAGRGPAAGRLHPLPRGRRRRGPDRLPVGQGPRPAAHRHGRHRRQVPAGAGRMAQRTRSTTAPRTSPSASRRSRAARA